MADMSPTTARRLAALIAADAQQLEERAQQAGVTAFLGRAVQRERPNERFLQNTLRNLASSNKRQEEKLMWAAWQADQEKEQQQQNREQRQRPREQREGRPRQQDWHAQPRGVDDSLHRRADGSPRMARQHSADPARRRSRSPERSRKRGRSRSRSRGRHHSHSRSPPASRRRRSGSRSPGRSRHRRTSRSRSRSRHAAAGGSPPPAAADGVLGDGVDAAAAAPGSPQHSSGDWSEGNAAGDAELLEWLGSSRAVRGRGSIGPRADLPGPYLPVPQGGVQLQDGKVRGPDKPSWMQQPAEGGERAKPNTAFLRGVLATQGLAAGRERAAQAGESGGWSTSSSSSSTSSGSESGSASDSSSSRRRRRRSKKSKRTREDRAGRSKRSKHKKSKTKSKEKRSKRSKR